MADPQPGSPAQPGQPAQLALAMVDTPDGQRLAAIIPAAPVQVTVLLTGTEAKTWAKLLADAAASMSTTGLVIANGAMTPR